MFGSPPGTRPPQAGPSVATAAPAARAPLNEGQDAMSGDTIRHAARVRNPNGFHLRPVTEFVKMAQRYQSTVTVSKDGRKVDGKSPLELLFLGAAEGSELLVEANGPDAPEAIAALVELIERFPSDDDPEAPLPPKG